MEICRRISQPGLKFLKLLTLNVLIKQFTSISSLWNKKIKKKSIVVRFCLAFDIRFFDAHSIYQKRYCENIGPDALDMKYQQEIMGRNTKLNNLTWFPLGSSLKFLFRLWGRSFVIVMAKIQHTMAVPQNNMIFFFNYYWE